MRRKLSNKGFTLIEVLISMAIYAIVLASIAPAFMGHMRFITGSEIRSEAIAAAQQVMDQLRFDDPSTMPTSGSDTPRTVDVGDRTYSVIITYCEEASYCITNNSRHIKAGVFLNNEERYSVETVYTKLR